MPSVQCRNRPLLARLHLHWTQTRTAKAMATMHCTAVLDYIRVHITSYIIIYHTARFGAVILQGPEYRLYPFIQPLFNIFFNIKHGTIAPLSPGRICKRSTIGWPDLRGLGWPGMAWHGLAWPGMGRFGWAKENSIDVACFVMLWYSMIFQYISNIFP